MTKIFKSKGQECVRVDEVFHHQHKKGGLPGIIFTHIDDFGMIKPEEFLDRIEEGIKRVLTISNVEK